MAYFNGDLHGRLDLRTGRFIHGDPCTAVYCNACAETAIPLPEHGPNGTRVGRHWGTGFKWAPVYGDKCHKCGARC